MQCMSRRVATLELHLRHYQGTRPDAPVRAKDANCVSRRPFATETKTGGPERMAAESVTWICCFERPLRVVSQRMFLPPSPITMPALTLGG